MKTVLTAFAITVGAIAQPVAASTITLTWEGRFVSGLDQTSFFGLGTNLASVPYKIVFTFDDATPGAIVVGASGLSSLSGHGLGFDNPPQAFDNSPGTADIIVNGVSFPIAGDYTSLYSRRVQGGNWFLDTEARDTGVELVNGQTQFSFNRQVTFELLVTGILPTTNLTDPLSFEVHPPPLAAAELHLQLFRFDFSSSTFEYLINATTSGGESGGTRLTVTSDAPVSAPVPEPATLALLITGLGFAGSRRLKRHIRS